MPCMRWHRTAGEADASQRASFVIATSQAWRTDHQTAARVFMAAVRLAGCGPVGSSGGAAAGGKCRQAGGGPPAAGRRRPAAGAGGPRTGIRQAGAGGRREEAGARHRRRLQRARLRHACLPGRCDTRDASYHFEPYTNPMSCWQHAAPRSNTRPAHLRQLAVLCISLP